MMQGIKSGMTGDIAWGVVITCALFVLALVFPLVGFCFIPFVPVPTLFYRCKSGRNASLILMLVTMVILTVFTGQLGFDSIIIALLLLTGYFLGEQFLLQPSVEEAIFKSCGIVLGFGAVAVFGFSLISAIKLGDVVHGFVTQNLELTLAIYREAGVAQETIDSIVGVREKIELILTRLLPAFIVTSMLFVSWISVLTARVVFGLKSIPYPDFGRLNRWKAPEMLVWAAIFCGAAVFLPQLGVRWIGINGLLILATIYFFQGIAIVAFYFEKKRLPKLLRAVLYGMILLQPLIFIVIILFGFFDMWINFRRLNRASDQSSTDE